MKNDILEIIEKYIQCILQDKYHRYSSWDNCFTAFSNPERTENQVLELAFYLASWGMYRGSSGLLQKNHLIHKGAVDILYTKKSQKLKCNQTTELKEENIIDILEVRNELANHYRGIDFTTGVGKIKHISPTDTLLSKVMLGTLGCVPAYDRYFMEGLKKLKIQHIDFSESSLVELFNFISNNYSGFNQAQKLILIKTKRHYLLMKILDMYFWQTGFDMAAKAKCQIMGN